MYKAIKSNGDINQVMHNGEVLWKKKKPIPIKDIWTASTYGNTKKEYLIDGIKRDDSKRWISKKQTNISVSLDFPRFYAIEEVVIYSGNNGGTSNFIKDIYMEFNGEYFKAKVGEYEFHYKFSEPKRSDGIWMWFPDNTANQIYEIEVYGEPVN